MWLGLPGEYAIFILVTSTFNFSILMYMIKVLSAIFEISYLHVAKMVKIKTDEYFLCIDYYIHVGY